MEGSKEARKEARKEGSKACLSRSAVIVYAGGCIIASDSPMGPACLSNNRNPRGQCLKRETLENMLKGNMVGRERRGGGLKDGIISRRK